METVSSDYARHNLRDLLNRVSKGEKIAISRYNSPEAILLSMEAWEKIQAELKKIQANGEAGNAG
jgi:prevent-host-death family protein